MKKITIYSLILILIFGFNSCKEKNKENCENHSTKNQETNNLSDINPDDPHCAMVSQLIGRQFLDSKYLKEIKSIPISEKKSNSLDGMVLIKGGQFDMGGDFIDGFEKSDLETALPQKDELPKHSVKLSDFYMDEHEVTVAEFKEFIDATGYKTIAEQDIDWEEMKKQLPARTPKPDDEYLKAGSLLFEYAPEGTPKNNLGNWWKFTIGINWKNPDGKDRKLEEIKNWPVTHVSFYDAMAYAAWVGKRLPTEAEFEYAMRGGKTNNLYPWGNEIVDKGNVKGNFLQGDFPYFNSAKDGFEFLAPVKSFKPNGYGLYDMSGNVWEWTSDWYSPYYYQELADKNEVAINPKGPQKTTENHNPNAIAKAIKGGSYLCNDAWCSGFRNARRMRSSPDSGMQHLGFRLVRDVE